MRIKLIIILISGIMASLTGAAPVIAQDSFLWKYSYGRGVGTPFKLACPSGTQPDGKGIKTATICYKPCRDGYHGVGPVCWANSYDRGVGVPLKSQMVDKKVRVRGKCHIYFDSRKNYCDHHWQTQRVSVLRCPSSHPENISSLCYRTPKAGYHCSLNSCVANGKPSYGRGAGVSVHAVCDGGKKMENALCYKPCRSGTKGNGPVCWGDKPNGWYDCSAFAVAKDKTTCGLVTAGQAAAVVSLTIAACEIAGNPGCGAVAMAERAGLMKAFEEFSEEVTKVGTKISEELAPLAERVANLISKNAPSSEVAKEVTNAKEIEEVVEGLTSLQKAMVAAKSSKALPPMYDLAIVQPDINTYSGRLAIARDAATIASVAIMFATAEQPPNPGVDMSLAALGMISSFAYPVQGN